MYYAPRVHESDRRGQLSHDLRCSWFTQSPRSGASEQLPTGKQLHDHVGVHSVLVNIDQFDDMGVTLAGSKEVYLVGTVDAFVDDFDGVFLESFSVPTAPTHRVTAVSKSSFVNVDFVLLEEGGFLAEVTCQNVRWRWPSLQLWRVW